MYFVSTFPKIIGDEMNVKDKLSSKYMFILDLLNLLFNRALMEDSLKVSEIERFILNLVNNTNHPSCKTKRAESKGLCLFTCSFLHYLFTNTTSSSLFKKTVTRRPSSSSAIFKSKS